MTRSNAAALPAKVELLRNLAEIYERSTTETREAISVNYLLEIAEIMALHFDGDERPLRPLVDVIEHMVSPVDARAENERRSA